LKKRFAKLFLELFDSLNTIIVLLLVAPRVRIPELLKVPLLSAKVNSRLVSEPNENPAQNLFTLALKHRVNRTIQLEYAGSLARIRR